MARNFIQPGNTITWTNDGDVDVASGEGVVVDALFGVAKVDIAIGDSGELALVDVWELPKVSAQAWTQGVKVYWADGEATTTEDSNVLIGVAIEATDNPSATGKVRLSAAFIGGGGGGEELPAPPEGFHYLVNADGEYLVNADGDYVLVDGD